MSLNCTCAARSINDVSLSLTFIISLSHGSRAHCAPCCFCFTSASGKKAGNKNRKKGNGKVTSEGLDVFFSYNWIPSFGMSDRYTDRHRFISISPSHRIRPQMKDRAFPDYCFLFSGEPKAQMGGVHVPDANLLRPLRLDASRYRPSGTQVFR